MDRFGLAFVVLMLFPPFLLVSLIASLFPYPAFRAWAVFALWWMPITLILALLVGGRGGGTFSSLLDNEVVLAWMTGLFVPISLGILAYHAVKAKRGSS